MTNSHMIKTVKCAHCGKTREQANHWFVLAVVSGKFRCRPLASSVPAANQTPSCGTPGPRLKESDEPVCGQQCAQKLFERYLAGEMIRRTTGLL
jgi:endogenous inhibitor of DNA gyrase (YacG/DUF329 family)